MDRMSYWDERFEKEGMIWGTLPSRTVSRADSCFQAHNCKTLLVPGCGYGRNAHYFQMKGYKVTGIDLSGVAIDMARKINTNIDYITGSILDTELKETFDAIYGYNILHLFLAADRKKFITRCQELLSPGGVAFFTVFSDQEKDYGNGRLIEPSTFESKPGRPAHYFTGEDLLNHFSHCIMIEQGMIEEQENHGAEGHHIHFLRYIAVKS
jgi:SAM-dependent methyltransferase